MSVLSRLFAEFRRRHVFRVAAMYAVVAWILMQIGEVTFPALALPDWTLTLVIVLLVFGFPIALILAWAFDVTPEGLVRTPPDDDAAQPAGSEAEADAPSAAAADPDLDGDGIVVLPFENMSPDAENEYFSDGVAEDLIARLCKVESLRVISRTSAWRYKAAPAGAPQIASDLGVAHLVQGSVRRSGTSVRITAQLIDARADRHVWSETYDRELEDIFAIQSEVASCIADALHVTLRGDMAEVCDVSGPSDLEAYDLYLKGRFHWNRRTADDLTESVTNLKSAIERDPDFALARAALAEAYVTLAVYGYRPAAEALSSARSEAEAALAVDPAEASALSALACVRAIHDWTWDAAETAFLGAIEANPQYATAAQWYATNLLIPLGRYDEAIVQLERARAVDPMSPSVRASFGLVEFMRADYETAFGTFDMLARRDGGFTFAHYYRGLSLLYLDRHREAIDALRTARDAGGGAEVRAALGCAEAAAGREDDARVTLERLIEGSGATYVSPVRIAQLHACLSEPEEALDRLEEAVASRAADLIWLDVFPPFASLRDHPRYAGIRDKVFGKEQADG